jgi:hypothetical protein
LATIGGNQVQPVEVAASEVPVRPHRRLTLGNTLTTALEIWTSNVPFYVGVALLARLPGVLLSSFEVVHGGLGKSDFRFSGIVDLVLSYVATGLVTTSVIDRLRGRPSSYRRSLSLGASRMGALVSWGFSTSLSIGVLSLLLFVPGIVAAVRWMLVAPVVVAEPDAEARVRSSKLTEGHRWEIFGLLVLFRGGAIGSYWAAVALLGPRQTLLSNAVTAGLGVLLLSLQSIVEGALYEQLRIEKDGADLGQLTAVFE